LEAGNVPPETVNVNKIVHVCHEKRPFSGFGHPKIARELAFLFQSAELADVG
jgi:hypothetical protein